ncbi:radical SAM protein [Streptomyces sp. APSN-46.1]|uniref:radical SAM protein n=1 Tax=Streptomyces sp. APSN-46.1 TaxID=2929049 RepID=UPI001FB437D2|nr:radical SAM protein [Streptomyces sp. APSN-46.1]MCJ1677583.1 radical SAM protein [Streptomyces sp. APSN-46.1]
MHDLIAAPYEDEHLLLRPDSPRAVKIPYAKYAELQRAMAAADPVPGWLADVARRAWGFDLTGRPVAGAVLVRPRSRFRYNRGTWEINLGCDYDCEMCYLGEKRFEGLDWAGKERLLHQVRDAGVIWFQITGGEPLIDPDFPAAYRLANELGMVVEILSNGSRLWHPGILELFTTWRPAKLTLSLYGATAETYDGLTGRRGGFNKFVRGLDGAIEAGLNIDVSLIITRRNAHEQTAMRAFAERHGLPWREYANMSPTIHGGAETLPSQSPEHLTQRAPFTGCPAGHTFFHVDPHGKASICKVGRDPSVDLVAEGVEGLARLGSIADSLMLRTGGCEGCTLSGTCRVCRPMARLFQEAKAPLINYCQHGQPKETSPVMLELAPTRTIEPQDGEDIQIIDNIDAYTAPTAQGCGDDNPYN